MKRFLFIVIGFFSFIVSFAQNPYTVVHLDTNVIKVHNGINYDTINIFKYTEADTIYIVNGSGDTINYTIDTNTYDAINICLGDSIKIRCYGVYNDSLNRNEDIISYITWILGDGNTITDYGTEQCISYTEVGCYDITVSMLDQYGNTCDESATLRVRIAENPVKRIFDLGNICSTDSLLIDVGYGADSYIMLKEIDFSESVTKEYAVKTFIPDGMNQCPTACFTADVNFSEFPNGRTIMSADDICSVCINMEHSFMGDIRMSLVCPSGQKAVLKYGTPGYDQNIPAGAPTGSFGGSSQYLGIPYGGSSDSPYDNLQNNYCDSVYNMYGDGLTYCFSRNGSYTFASGNPADITTLTTDDYIASTNQAYLIQYTNYNFQTIPAPYTNAGTTASPSTFRTKRPSDHDNKSDYYAPAEDFSSLIGCPLNGNWSIEVCDFWPADNGWVFSWNMDICGISNGSCEYIVPVDSVRWSADANLNFTYKDSINAVISAVDSCGLFPVYLNVFDNFGCVWKDTTRIGIVKTPEPNIGKDTAICQYDTVILHANDPYTQYHDTYTYIWEPNGITIEDNIGCGSSGQNIIYVVEATNTRYNLSCRNRDSIMVKIKDHPQISFEPRYFPLEGCEPFNLNIMNHSRNVVQMYWDFGDGYTTYDFNPIHNYSEGTYTLSCFATSADGCKDSLKYEDLITVFSSPDARFSWEPVNPTVTNPVVHLNNRTIGTNPEYRWEIQYDKDYTYSYHTLVDENPDFVWYTDGKDISGEYIIRLIAKTNNIGPSGNIITCKDTTENTVLIVNDFIQFPNVVTPNGDGINDRFVIVNLLSGAYPVNRLDIYNRWGGLVYHIDNISKDEDFWDPNATKSPDGTYFFRFSAVGYTGNVERHGVIEVLR